MHHAGTYGTSSGRQLADHEAGTFIHDPLSDDCPLCLDPTGCPVNGHGVEDCRRRHEEVASGEMYGYGALAAACARHGVPHSGHRKAR